jgi:hypothetical protein
VGNQKRIWNFFWFPTNPYSREEEVTMFSYSRITDQGE